MAPGLQSARSPPPVRSSQPEESGPPHTDWLVLEGEGGRKGEQREWVAMTMVPNQISAATKRGEGGLGRTAWEGGWREGKEGGSDEKSQVIATQGKEQGWRREVDGGLLLF